MKAFSIKTTDLVKGDCFQWGVLSTNVYIVE